MKTLLLALLLSPALAIAAPAESARAKVLNYDPAIVADASFAGWSLRGCTIRDIQIQGKDPVSGETRTVQVKEYSARGAGNEKAVVLLPPTGGENILDRGWGNVFCANGIRLLLVQHWAHDDFVSLELTMHDQGALRALAAVRHTVEYAETTGSSRLGILGTSVGALTSTLALGVEPRLRTGALVVGGHGFADIISRTTEQGAAKLREERLKKFGFTEKQYAEALAQAVSIEPVDFWNPAAPKPVMMVVAKQDVTVPSDTQYALAEKLHPAELLEIDDNHVNTVIATYWKHSDSILSFFQRSL